ncbi:uncharacterized protein LOC130976318 [Arachis stenosperma]|uniref:uncharacterized protein LOC130976318 n=1 Tax=Arachis stenosperma TaxID=217475 RepID=UPI0025AD206E|nr:uncharacterized protein LOC130976318 [Arachis stenosperma]
MATNPGISIHSQASSITMFNGLNFSEWNEQMKFHLGLLDLDLSLLEEKPIVTDDNDEDKKYALKTWERSNILSIMFMRMTTASNIKTTLPQTESAKEYLAFVEDRFCSTDKSLVSTLMS